MGVNRIHRSENLKIECIFIDEGQLIFGKGFISVQITTVGPLPIPVDRTIISPVERTTINSSGVDSITPSAL